MVRFQRGEKFIRFVRSGLAVCLIFGFGSYAAHAQCSFKTIGHRGGSSYYFPENTLVSLEQGFMEGIYAAEVDVRFTGDSVLVLMHDSFVDRTTNGHGEIEDLSLSTVRSLDAGSWKGNEFSETKVPTLKEALLLAAKYQKKLYLNMKVFVPELIAQTLSESNLPGDMILLDPDDLDKVAVYHEILPNTPLVYFGYFPEDEQDDDEFFGFLKGHGVVAIEIPADFIYNAPERYGKLRDEARENQIETWAYTVNDMGYFQYLKDFGVDAIETDRPSEASRFFCDDVGAGYFPEKRITGQWDFDGSLKGTVGSQLVAMGDTSVAGQKIQFGTTKTFGLPDLENKEVPVARIPAFDPAHALRFFSNIAPEGLPGGLDCDNTYTVIFDLLKPAGDGAYTALLQTSNNNSDDADFFLWGPDNEMGVAEQYHGGFADSAWVRLALVFDLYEEKLTGYLDGKEVGTVELENAVNGRFSLNNNWGIQASNFFADDDGETNPLFVSSIQIRNYAMSPEEISLLGKCRSSKIDRTIVAPGSCPEFSTNLTGEKSGDLVRLSVFAGDSVNYRWEMNSGDGWKKVAGDFFRGPASPVLQILTPNDLDENDRFRCVASTDCASVSDEIRIGDIGTAVNQPESANALFTMYPNPSNGRVTILTESGTPGQLRVFTINGQLVAKKKLSGGVLQLELRRGTYLVQVITSRMTGTQKLIVN